MMQSHMLVLAVGLVAVVTATNNFAPQKAVVLIDSVEVEICKCCYNDTSRVKAREIRVTVRPEGYAWLPKDDRVSIDVRNCVARNGAPNTPSPAQLVNDRSVRTAVAKTVNLELQKLQDPNVFNNNPHFSGTFCPFILGPPPNIYIVNTELSCDIVYCYANINKSDPEACQVNNNEWLL